MNTEITKEAVEPVEPIVEPVVEIKSTPNVALEPVVEQQSNQAEVEDSLAPIPTE